MFYKTSTARNFHRLYTFKENDLCALYKKPFLGPVGKAVKACHETFPQICHECPYEPGNITLHYVQSTENCAVKDNTKNPVLLAINAWPDGDYLFVIKIFTKRDPDGFTLKYYWRIKNGDNRAF
jgi:hypothetical protein